MNRRLFQTHEKRLTSFDRRRARFDSRPGFRRRRYSHSRRVNSRAPLVLVSSNVQLFSNCVVSLESQLRVNAFTARYESVVQTPTTTTTARTTSNNATTTTLLGDERSATSEYLRVSRLKNGVPVQIHNVVIIYPKNRLPFGPPLFSHSLF